MPFRETCAMEERIAMLTEYEAGHWSVSELCRRHGVSRDTFYVWRARRASGDPDWFKDRSHAPRTCPHRTPSDKEEALLAARREFPHFLPAQAVAGLAAPLRRDGVAGGLDHRRHLGPGGPHREGPAPAGSARSAAAGDRGRGGQRGVGRRFQGLVPHARPAAHRSADDHRQPHPVSDRDAHCPADGRGRAGRVHPRLRGLRPAAGDPLSTTARRSARAGRAG